MQPRSLNSPPARYKQVLEPVPDGAQAALRSILLTASPGEGLDRSRFKRNYW